MDNEKLITNDALLSDFEKIPGIESLMCVLGLSFPEGATAFQRAFLTLAHLMASARDYVLKGQTVPFSIINWIDQLNTIVFNGESLQK